MPTSTARDPGGYWSRSPTPWSELRSNRPSPSLVGSIGSCETSRAAFAVTTGRCLVLAPFETSSSSPPTLRRGRWPESFARALTAWWQNVPAVVRQRLHERGFRQRALSPELSRPAHPRAARRPPQPIATSWPSATICSGEQAEVSAEQSVIFGVAPDAEPDETVINLDRKGAVPAPYPPPTRGLRSS